MKISISSVDGNAKARGNKDAHVISLRNDHRKLQIEKLPLPTPKYESVNSGYFITKWLAAVWKENTHHERTQDQPLPVTLVYQMNMMLLSLSCIHVERTSSGLHSSSHFPHIPLSLSVYPWTKNKKFSRWTFTSITHVSHNQLQLFYQESYPHSTSTWKALVNFTFVLNGLYYI